MAEPVTTREEWFAEGVRRFGADPLVWRFKCPVCGNVQTPAEFKAVKVGMAPWAAYSNCIGRYQESARRAFGPKPKGTPERPCDYASGGLFKVGRRVVLKGVEYNVFPFAD